MLFALFDHSKSQIVKYNCFIFYIIFYSFIFLWYYTYSSLQSQMILQQSF